MKLLKKNIFLFSLIAVLSMPGFSNAEITFQPPSPEQVNPTEIFNNLPQPLSDLIEKIKDIGSGANDQFGKYINISALQNPINVNLNQLKDVNVTQWLQDIFQSGSSNGLYQLAVKALNLVGNFFVWILNIVIELINQALSLLSELGNK